MEIFTGPTSYRLNALNGDTASSIVPSSKSLFIKRDNTNGNHYPHLGQLSLLIFEAVMEVICVSLPGYIIARRGMLNADHQKFLANLNITLFSPCLIFTKLASQLTADKLLDLAIIPVVFAVQTMVSYLVSVVVAKAFGFTKRPANFVTAMGVRGAVKTLTGLHWDKIPGDNNDEVAARGILYLLIFQQLGLLVRWSWGYYVLLAPPETDLDVEHGRGEERYTDDPELISGLEGEIQYHRTKKCDGSSSTVSLRSDNKTIITKTMYTDLSESDNDSIKQQEVYSQPINAGLTPNDNSNPVITSFPSIRTVNSNDEQELSSGLKGLIPLIRFYFHYISQNVKDFMHSIATSIFSSLPSPTQHYILLVNSFARRFLAGVWEFMNPPLWAMLSAVIVASIPRLQHVFFAEGSFIANSFTRAISQSGGVAVPLILVVLGANLARNTLPQESLNMNSEENRIGTKLLVASLLSRMVFPALIMAPILALIAKYIPISIVDDPIFVVVCFLIVGAPSALQLAQICQINGVFEGVISKLLFQSYVVWILPSTLALVTCALEVVKWANISK